MDQQLQNYKSGIEALLFVSEKPMSWIIQTVFPELKSTEITDLVKPITGNFGIRNRHAGMVIVDIAQGWQMYLTVMRPGISVNSTKQKQKKSCLVLPRSVSHIAYKHLSAVGFRNYPWC